MVHFEIRPISLLQASMSETWLGQITYGSECCNHSSVQGESEWVCGLWVWCVRSLVIYAHLYAKQKPSMLFRYLFRLLTCKVLSICYIYLFDKLPLLPYVYSPEVTAVRRTTVLNRESSPAPGFICVTSAVKSLGVKAADCIRALVQRRGWKQVGERTESGPGLWPCGFPNTTKLNTENMVRCRFNDLISF